MRMDCKVGVMNGQASGCLHERRRDKNDDQRLY